MTQHSKTLQLECGGSVTLTIDVDIFKLKGEEREFVFELIEIFRGDDEQTEAELKQEQPREPEKPPYRKVTEEIKQQALEMVRNGSTVSAAAIALGVHRNSLANAGIRFGGDSPEIETPAPPPFVCLDCGGPRSAGSAQRCKDCYEKQVAKNKLAEEQYRAEVAERKRQREGAGQITEASGVKVGQRFGSLVVEEIRQERGHKDRPYFARCLCDCGKSRTLTVQYLATAFEEGDQLACTDCSRAEREAEPESDIRTCRICGKPRSDSSGGLCLDCFRTEPQKTLELTPEVKAKARDLLQEHIAQCKKLGIRPDTPIAEFYADAAEILRWEREHPGEPYLDRYEGKITAADFVGTNYTQYQSPTVKEFMWGE